MGLAQAGLDGLLKRTRLLFLGIKCLFALFDCRVEMLLEQVVVYENRVGDGGELPDEIKDVLALHLCAIVNPHDVVKLLIGDVPVPLGVDLPYGEVDFLHPVLCDQHRYQLLLSGGDFFRLETGSIEIAGEAEAVALLRIRVFLDGDLSINVSLPLLPAKVQDRLDIYEAGLYAVLHSI